MEGSYKIPGIHPEDLQASARRQLEALDVRIRTSVHVTDFQPGYVMVGEERIDSVCSLWAAGVQASPLGGLLGVACDKKGCVLVDEHLNPEGHPEILSWGTWPTLSRTESKYLAWRSPRFKWEGTGSPRLSARAVSPASRRPCDIL